MTRVLLCANPDLKHIDGSSIWAQTFALVLGAVDGVQIDFVAVSTPVRDELFAPLDRAPNIRIVNGVDEAERVSARAPRLSQSQMGKLAADLDVKANYDVVVVRGFQIASSLLQSPRTLAKTWLYLTDIPQDLGDCSPDQRQTLAALARGCSRILCQTEGFVSLWKALVPGLPASKFHIYSPVIDDIRTDLTPLAERRPQAVYAGKFKPEWMTLEMVEAWPAIVGALPSAELIVMGDKIHNDPDDPEYAGRMRTALLETRGVLWLGARSRRDTQIALQQGRVGLSWRAPSMDDTVELSTKVLEYGAAGCGVILNRNPLHEEILGADYPLFANDAVEFERQVLTALTDIAVVEEAARRLGLVAERHTFAKRVAEVRDWLAQDAAAHAARVARMTGKRPIVLVAGHDLKFFESLQRELEQSGQYNFIRDQWRSHDVHDEERSRALLAQADVIVSEWCLGNLEWYSKNKRPGQRLVGRFHRQEVERDYVARANWDNIDHITYVSESIRRDGQKAFGFPFEKTSVIPNLLDRSKFTARQKKADARFTLGIIGVAPARKRLDRAVDLLEALVETDPRYFLRVKGQHPLAYGWLAKREAERQYYADLFQRINASDTIRHKVIFDPPGDDVNDWFAMVGFILSPSDFESFHMAIGEGLLTGTTPVIWPWDGAADIWGDRWIVNSIEDAKRLVLANEPIGDQAELALGTLGVDQVVERWLDLLDPRR